ncbi:unnamed protein product [Didymodactylos carnosus]|nr:unnamed protein product [Didymodactylos carnosus]CAF3991385.1 unnamed protein product [Didymodactylos carnosus]
MGNSIFKGLIGIRQKTPKTGEIKPLHIRSSNSEIICSLAPEPTSEFLSEIVKFENGDLLYETEHAINLLLYTNRSTQISKTGYFMAKIFKNSLVSTANAMNNDEQLAKHEFKVLYNLIECPFFIQSYG